MITDKELIVRGAEVECLLRDISVFINHQLETEKNPDYRGMIATIGHDVGGVLNRERLFCPRVSDYADSVRRQEAKS